MARIKTDSVHYKNIANKIRGKTGGTESYRPSEMPRGIDKVYESGVEDGKKAEWDAFWDAYQQNGKRTGYQRCFGGGGWTAETFRPKYDVNPKWGGGTAIFRDVGFVGNLKEHLATLGVKLDFSGLTAITQAFYGAVYITELPDIDISGCVNGCDYLFHSCAALTTVKIIISDTVYVDANCFMGCTALENLTIEGTIGQNFAVSYCSQLTIESLKSIITHLKDYSGTEQEYTKSLTLSSDSKTLLNAQGATSPNGNLWTQYIADLGWNLK